MSNTVFSPVTSQQMTFTDSFGEPMYKALVPWKQESVWIDVSTGTDQPLTPAQLDQVNAELCWLWDNWNLVEAQFGEGSELLREKNQNLFEDEQPYDAAAFAAQILLEAIQLNLAQDKVDSLQLWYDDGELFGGASILLEWKEHALSHIHIQD